MLNYSSYAIGSFVNYYAPIGTSVERTYILVGSTCTVLTLGIILIPLSKKKRREGSHRLDHEQAGQGGEQRPVSKKGTERSRARKSGRIINENVGLLDWILLATYFVVVLSSLACASTEDTLRSSFLAQENLILMASSSSGLVARIDSWHAFNALRIALAFLGYAIWIVHKAIKIESSGGASSSFIDNSKFWARTASLD